MENGHRRSQKQEVIIKLSIFPKAKHLPSKEEKDKEAKYTSKPHLPETLEFNSTEDLIEIICSKTWSPSVFSGYRRQDNFVSTDLMVLDIDDGMKIEEAEEIVHNLDVICLCIPSTSFTEEDHRFRLIFPLSRTVQTVGDFKATMEKLTEYFPADPSCVGDTARFYFGGKLVNGFVYEDGKLLESVKVRNNTQNNDLRHFESSEIVSVGETIEELVEALYEEKRDKIPEAIAYFLENAHTGLHGEFHNSANSFLFTASLMGCKYENIEKVFRSACPEPLDKHDINLLKRATRDGYEARIE